MKQRPLERRLQKLNLKFLKAKTELIAAKRRAASTRLAARAVRQAQRMAKKKAHAARDAARTAESAWTAATRGFSKISARLEKLQKKALKAVNEGKARQAQPAKAASKRAKPRRIPAPPFPVSGADSSAPAIAKATAVAAKRGALQRTVVPRPAPVRPITTVTPLPATQVAAAS